MFTQSFIKIGPPIKKEIWYLQTYIHYNYYSQICKNKEYTKWSNSGFKAAAYWKTTHASLIPALARASWPSVFCLFSMSSFDYDTKSLYLTLYLKSKLVDASVILFGNKYSLIFLWAVSQNHKKQSQPLEDSWDWTKMHFRGHFPQTFSLNVGSIIQGYAWQRYVCVCEAEKFMMWTTENPAVSGYSSGFNSLPSPPSQLHPTS